MILFALYLIDIQSFFMETTISILCHSPGQCCALVVRDGDAMSSCLKAYAQLSIHSNIDRLHGGE